MKTEQEIREAIEKIKMHKEALKDEPYWQVRTETALHWLNWVLDEIEE